ncbi:MAG: hypothetical protein ACK4PH_04395 [Aquincola tertiaricarbonis]
MMSSRPDRSPPPASEWAFGVRRGLLIAAAIGVLTLPPLGLATRMPQAGAPGPTAALSAAPAPVAAPRLADFGAEQPSPSARHVADWTVDANDHGGKPFVVVDKQQARVYVFDAQGRLSGASPVLLGLAVGDDSVPGIGDRPIPLVKPEERTTPAGRFIGERGSNTSGEDVVWVDYDAAVSMHRVRPLVAAERRLERLASPTPEDNRISYGCINVPAAFFDAHIEPLFRRMQAVVYVLPETRPVQAVFHSYDVRSRHAALGRTTG